MTDAAPPPFICSTLTHTAAILDKSDSVEAFRQLSEVEGARAQRVLNAMPPPSNYSYSTVLLVTMKDGRLLVLMGNGGEMCDLAVIPVDGARAFLAAVEGDRS